MNDHTIVTTKVSVLEARAIAAEKRATQEEFIRDATIQKAVEQAVENFKKSEEYVAIMTTQCDMGYDTWVEEIFFNIRRKLRDVDYRFLGWELRNNIARSIDKEKDGILDTRPTSSPQYFEAKEDDEVMEVTPPNKVLEQAPPADAREEEEIASNPSPAEDELAPITLNEVAPITSNEDAPINVEEKEPPANTADDTP